jgi:HAD superfamily 5'-nucleotidase-like hydrolase
MPLSEPEIPIDLPPASRRVFANRTLNVRSIAAIGFDMDYTLVHYRSDEWEKRAYAHAKARLPESGFRVDGLEFDARAFTMGLVVDTKLGNVVKANRFGFVKRAAHGMRMLDFDEQRRIYSRVIVDLAEPRWVFMNTLFSLSETCLYAQLVDLVDRGGAPAGMSYEDAYAEVRTHLDAAHMEGTLKAEIVQDPERFVVLDPELALSLCDMAHAGKKLLLVTNSDWDYARAMMSFAFDRFLGGESWRSLFEIVIVDARKPHFFTGSAPLFEVDVETGLLRKSPPVPKAGGVYLGGDARTVEQMLGVPGEEILYVGDHVFSDVHVSKDVLRWRTALVVRELEEEMAALEAFRPKQEELTRLMAEKERLEFAYDQCRIALQRVDLGYGPRPGSSPSRIRRQMQELRGAIHALDARIAPLSRDGSELLNPRWGLLMRAGNDKSHLARQIERYADVYASRVANFLFETPFAYLRSPRGSLPHDP